MKNYLTKLYDHLPEDAPNTRPTLPPPFRSTTQPPFGTGAPQQHTTQGTATFRPFDFSKVAALRGGSPFSGELIPRGMPPGTPDPRPTPTPNDHPNRGNGQPDPNATPDVPRPIARARWNPDAAQFGDLQPYWQQGIAMWGPGFAKEMGGYPQGAVADLLSILKMNEDSMRTTGKPALVKVDGVQMGYADAIKNVLDKMRSIAAQVDQNYVATKNAVNDKAKFDADQLNKIPLMPRISPIIFQ